MDNVEAVNDVPLRPPLLQLPPNANSDDESQPEMLTSTAASASAVCDGPDVVDGESDTNSIVFLGSDNIEDIEAVNDVTVLGGEQPDNVAPSCTQNDTSEVEYAKQLQAQEEAEEHFLNKSIYEEQEQLMGEVGAVELLISGRIDDVLLTAWKSMYVTDGDDNKIHKKTVLANFTNKGAH